MSTDFYSMNTLIEFDMCMAIANQMTSSMNHSLNQMQVPGAGKAMPMNADNAFPDQWSIANHD